MDALSVHRVRGGARRRAPRPNETFVVPALILTVLTRSAAPRRPPRRFVPQKLYLSSAHAKAIPGTCSPGPAYDPQSSIGHQPLSHAPTPPRPPFLVWTEASWATPPAARTSTTPTPNPRASKSRPRRVRRPLLRGFPAPEREKIPPGAHHLPHHPRTGAGGVFWSRSSEANYLGRDTPAPTAYDLRAPPPVANRTPPKRPVPPRVSPPRRGSKPRAKGAGSSDRDRARTS